MSVTFTGPVPVPQPQKSGLTVLVTGASRGIGLELVQQYAEAHKDNVVVAAVRNPATSTALTSFASSHPNVRVVTLDVSKAETITASVAQTQRHVQHLDVLINNAGFYGDLDAADPLKATPEQLNAVFTINVTGPLLTIQAYLPLLRKSTVGAKVINVSSVIGSNAYANVFGKPILTYGLSKAALNYLNTAFRYAVPEVAFLSIHPGWVDTDMGRGAGAGSPPTQTKDSAQAIRYYVAEKGIKDSGLFLDVPSGNAIPY